MISDTDSPTEHRSWMSVALRSQGLDTSTLWTLWRVDSLAQSPSLTTSSLCPLIRAVWGSAPRARQDTAHRRPGARDPLPWVERRRQTC